MDDRLALRVGLLHLARQRRSLNKAAWAAARLRLDGVRLDSVDARYAHDALVRFGRAIRVSRARRDHETGHELRQFSFGTVSAPWSRRAIVRTLVAVGAIVGLIAFFLLRGVPAGVGDRTSAGGGTAVAVNTAPPIASPLRGRSQQFVAVLPVPTPAPTVKPTTGPGVGGTGGATGATGTGGSGGGTGGGSGAGVGTGAGAGDEGPSPTPKPTVMVLSITVTDANTRVGLPGVCVIYGSVTCATAPITDAYGNAMLRLSIGQLWHLQFERAGYITQPLDVTSDAASKSIAVTLVPSR